MLSGCCTELVSYRPFACTLALSVSVCRSDELPQAAIDAVTSTAAKIAVVRWITRMSASIRCSEYRHGHRTGLDARGKMRTEPTRIMSEP